MLWQQNDVLTRLQNYVANETLSNNCCNWPDFKSKNQLPHQFKCLLSAACYIMSVGHRIKLHTVHFFDVVL